MQGTFTRLYIHLVWSTWHRLPIIDNVIIKNLYKSIANKCRKMHCIPISIGGTDNHIHLLVSLHPTVSVSQLVKSVKGSSSHRMTHEIAPNKFFKWQRGYGAFTVSKEDLSIVKEYIQNQVENHSAHQLMPDWEPTIQAVSPDD